MNEKEYIHNIRNAFNRYLNTGITNIFILIHTCFYICRNEYFTDYTALTTPNTVRYYRHITHALLTLPYLAAARGVIVPGSGGAPLASVARGVQGADAAP